MKKRSKLLAKSSVAAVTAGILLALAGCGGNSKADSGETSNAANDTAAVTSAVTSALPDTVPAADQAAADELHFDLGINADIGDISPFGGVGTGRTYTKYTMYEYLLQFGEFGQTVKDMVRQVAKEVEVIDATTCRVVIYDYVQDAAGNPINAADVYFCYQGMLDSKNLPKLNQYVEKIEIIDDYTLDFYFTSSQVGTMEYVFCQVPIISRKAYEASGNNMATAPVSTAPYQVTEMIAGTSLSLAKNENYWQKEELRSYLAVQAWDTIKMHVITEAAQMTMALKSGTIDAATVVGGKELDNFVNPDGSAIAGFNAKRQTGGVAYSMMFNTAPDSPFAKLELRQAMCYALDNAAILAGASNGAGDLTHTAATVIAGDYNPKWDQEDYYDYNIEAAKAKLNEAGYGEGELTIRLMIENTSEYNKMAEIMQAFWMQIGVNTEILSYDTALFNTYRTEPDQWEIRMNAIGTSDFVVGAYELAVGSIAEKYLDDPYMTELLKTSSDTSTHTQENVDTLHYYIKDNCYAYGLYSQSTTSISNSSVEMVRHPWGQLIAGASKPAR